MNFLEYKKLLKSKGINLFDDEYRVSYHNIMILNYDLVNTMQTGGGNNKDFYYLSPLSLLRNSGSKDINRIKLIVSNLASGNIASAKYTCQSNIKLLYS